MLTSPLPAFPDHNVSSNVIVNAVHISILITLLTVMTLGGSRRLFVGQSKRTRAGQKKRQLV